MPIDRAGDGYRQEVVVTEVLGRIGFYPRAIDFATVVDTRYTADITEGNREP
jgi:sulfonate transport system substrate-binding protein